MFSNKGQFGVSLINLFTFLIIYFAISIAFVNILSPIISNHLSPAIQNLQFGSIGITLMYLVLSVIWFLIPIMAVAAYLGRLGGSNA